MRGEADEGDWLVAGRQTAGRGRIGRHWSSPPGNLYASTLIRVRPDDPPAPTLALLAGLALLAALPMAARLRSRLKWPNDVLLDGAKLAGILLERQDDVIVAGFGVNIASAPVLPDRTTASLCDFAEEAVSADSVLIALDAAFASALRDWRGGGAGTIVARWEAAGPAKGTRLQVALPDDTRISGFYAGLAADGGLRLHLADGQARVIHAGDVALI